MDSQQPRGRCAPFGAPSAVKTLLGRVFRTRREFSATQPSHTKKAPINGGFFCMARLGRFELPTFWFVARHSIQLSYSRKTVVGRAL